MIEDVYETPPEITRMREETRKIVVAHDLDKYIEKKMGGPPSLCIVGKSTDLHLSIDILDLCNIVGGRWLEWANKVQAERRAIQNHYDGR